MGDPVDLILQTLHVLDAAAGVFHHHDVRYCREYLSRK